MINEFFVCTAAGLMISIIAVVYAMILSREDILNWWFRFGSRYEKKWFHKPIWGCEKCIAGQIALWWYLITHVNVVLSQFKPGFLFFQYSILIHIYTVCIAVILARIWSKAIEHFDL